MMLQLQGGPPAPTWSRAAIHDSVAALARQRPYWRNPRTSPIERMLQWIAEQIDPGWEPAIEVWGEPPRATCSTTYAIVQRS